MSCFSWSSLFVSLTLLLACAGHRDAEDLRDYLGTELYSEMVRSHNVQDVRCGIEHEISWTLRAKVNLQLVKFQTEKRWDGRFDDFLRVFAYKLSEQPEPITSGSIQIDASNHAPVSATRSRLRDQTENVGLVPDEDGRRKIACSDEHWPDFGEATSQVLVFAHAWSFPETADDNHHWKPGEDKLRTLKYQLYERWPIHEGKGRGMEYWDIDRYDGTAIADMAFRGFAQHRLEKARQGDSSFAAYAIYLDDATSLPVRPGFARLGADAFFSAQGKLVGIRRHGTLHTPPGPHLTSNGHQQRQWDEVKMAFRGTLGAVVTAVDHLYSLHLVIGNAITVANQFVKADHPLRRLMTPFAFRTQFINYQSALTLPTDRGLLARSTGLTDEGLRQLFVWGKSQWLNRFVHSDTLQFKHVPEQFRDQEIDEEGLGFQIPLHEDGTKYFNVLLNFVRRFLAHFFNGKCEEDNGIQDWMQNLVRTLPESDVCEGGTGCAQVTLPELTCENVALTVATFMYHVTAEHRTVGCLLTEMEDPCLMPFAWREGELCGMPRSNLAQHITFLGTAEEMPKLVEDFSHVFNGEWHKLNAEDETMSLSEGKNEWAWLVGQLTELDTEIKAANDERAAAGLRRFRTFEAELLETSISI